MNKKIKIVYFLNTEVRGGAEEHLLNLLKYLDREKFAPVLVCPPKLIELLNDDLGSLKIRFKGIKLKRWRDFSKIREFTNFLKEEKPDIVHSHMFYASMFGSTLAKRAGVAVTIETAHIHERWRKGVKAWYAIDRFFSRFVDKYIAVSQAVEDYLSTDKKIEPGKIKVIHNGIDLEKFNPDRNYDSNNFRKIFSLGDYPVITIIGRLNFQKGHIYFLQAAAQVLEEIPVARFLIVGKGELEEELKNKAKELKIEKNVIFAGFQKNIPLVIASSDIVVLPSLFEGLPLVPIEAQAMVKPVIVTDVDGSPEVVKNRESGMVIPPRNIKVLSQAMLYLLKNENIAKEYGEAGRKFVKTNFSIEKQVQLTQELYLNLLNYD